MAQRFAQPERPDAALGEMLTQRQRWLLLFSLMNCIFVSALDNSIVATATPRILADLEGFNLLSWVFTVYMLTSTAVVPIVGKLSDMFGRKLFLIAGVIIFVIASALVGAAPSMMALIFARALQGIGGGMINACVFATLGDLFSPAERGKYIGFFTGTFSFAAITGPAVGGILTDTIGWRWCFYVNIPIGILAVYFISRNLPFRKKGGSLKQVDFLGAILLASATVTLLLALVWAQEKYGWGAPETVGLFAAAGMLAAAFIFQESRHPEAIFPLGIFRNRVFLQANILVMVSSAGVFGAIQYLPTFVQTSLGASATSSGFISTPQSVGLLTMSIIGGQLLSRTGKYKPQIITGACLMVVATVFLQTLGVGEAKWHISVYMGIYGLGAGLVMPSMSVITQSAVDHRFMGVATAGRQFFMQIGQVVGTAILGVVLATSYSSAFEKNVPADTATLVPAEHYERLKGDPTLPLDENEFPRIEQEIIESAGGTVALTVLLDAQKHAMATAITNIFRVSVGAALVILFLTITIPQIPLRRGFGSAGGGSSPPQPAASGPPREAVPERGG